MTTAEHTSAVETLQRMGYTYHGAQLWKPPLGVDASEPLRWEFAGPGGLKRFLTQKQYDTQTPGTQKWYRPICDKCGPSGVAPSDGGQQP